MDLRIRRILAVAVLALFCGACGQTVLPVESKLSAAPDPSLAYYHAYGDSITAGYLLPDPATQTYPALIAGSMHLPLLNFAIPGDQACDVPARQIFPNSDDPSTAARGLYSVLISTNDADIKGAGPYENVFNLCLGATIAWLALPHESKVFATAATVTKTGDVSLDATNNWNAMVTNGVGSTITFPLRLSISAPIYLWYRIADNNPGVFSYALDGKVLGLTNTATLPAIQTQNGNNNSLGFLRLPAVTAGAHVVTITQTSPSGQTGIVAVGAPNGASLATLPLVLVGTTPRQLIGGSTSCSLNDAVCQAYIADITAQVALFAADGLSVRLFDSRKYMTGTAADLIDSVHPNPKGQIAIAQAVADALY